jgi:hypothetical protein
VDPPRCKCLEPSALHRLGGEGAGVLVALAAHFSHSGTSDALLRRFGAISTLKGLQYWSVTEGGCRMLITDAGQDLDHRRPDVTLAEMRSGKDLYFAQSDNCARHFVDLPDPLP